MWLGRGCGARAFRTTGATHSDVAQPPLPISLGCPGLATLCASHLPQRSALSNAYTRQCTHAQVIPKRLVRMLYMYSRLLGLCANLAFLVGGARVGGRALGTSLRTVNLHRVVVGSPAGPRWRRDEARSRSDGLVCPARLWRVSYDHPGEPTSTEQHLLWCQRQRLLREVGRYTKDRCAGMSASDGDQPAYRFTTSNGPRRLELLPSGPEDRMIPLPSVTRTSSRALERKFWRYLRAASCGTDVGGNRPAA